MTILKVITGASWLVEKNLTLVSWLFMAVLLEEEETLPLVAIRVLGKQQQGLTPWSQTLMETILIKGVTHLQNRTSPWF